MPFQPFSFKGWSRGAILVGESDAIPEDSLRQAVNVRLDRTLRAIEPRPGWTRKTVSSIGAAITFLSRLFSRTGTWGYVQFGSLLRLTDSNWNPVGSAATVGGEVLSAVNSPDGHGTIWKFFANRGTFMKQPGSGTWLPVGIAPPTAAPLGASLATDLTNDISNMTNANLWTGTDVTSGPLDDNTTYQLFPPSSTQITIAASTFGSMVEWFGGVINLDLLAGGDPLVKNDDYIAIFVRCDFPERLVFLQIDIDVDATPFPGTTAFRNNYYSVRIPSLGKFNQGHNTWTNLQIRKSEFARFGTDITRSWATAQTFRIGAQTNAQGPLQLNFSAFRLRGGIGLEGDISYTVCYRNSSTMARGNPPKSVDFTVLQTVPITVDRQRVNLDISNVRTGGANVAGTTIAEQVDTIMVWRKGGTFLSHVLVDEIPFTAGSPYLDNTSDETLILTNLLLELDNDLPPVDTTGSQRVIFGPDGTGHYFMIVDGYKLYFCKPYETLENRIEDWPRLNFAFVGDGSSKALAGCCEGTQTYVWTDSYTYNVVGIGAETYLPVRIDGSRGIVGQHAWCAGEGALFFVSQDGIYMQEGQRQQKLTSAIDPFFQAKTVDGQLGWSTAAVAMALTRLEFLHEPTGPMLTMLYVQTDGSGLDHILVIKPNIQNGVLTECFFDFSTVTTAQSLYLDTHNKELLAGGANGHVYRLHDPFAYTDDGTNISILIRTQSSVCGGPTRSKYIDSTVVEGNTHGQSLRLTNHYERGTIDEIQGNIVTTTETALSFLSTPTPRTFRRDVSLQLTGNTYGRFTITRLGVMAELQPEFVTFFDSGDITFDFVHQVKVFLLDANFPTTVQIRLSIEQVIAFSGAVLPSNSRELVRYPLSAGLRGRVFRLTLAGTTPFLVYKVSGLVKQLGIEQEYTERLFMQGV